MNIQVESPCTFMLTQLYKYMTTLLFDIKNRFNITVVAMCARCERGKLYSIVRRSSWSAHVHFARDSDLLSGGALTNHNSEECNFESSRHDGGTELSYATAV